MLLSQHTAHFREHIERPRLTKTGKIFGGPTHSWPRDPHEQKYKSPKARAEWKGFPAIGIITERPISFEELRETDQLDRPAGSSENDPKPEVNNTMTYSSMPMYFLEDIQQDSFWDVYTRTFGGGLLKNNQSMIKYLDTEKGKKTYTFRYETIVRRSLELPRGLDGDRWRDDKKYTDPLVRKYVSERLLKERAIALKLHLSWKEDKRHKRLRKRNASWRDEVAAEQYVERRKKASREYFLRRKMLRNGQLEPDEELYEVGEDNFMPLRFKEDAVFYSSWEEVQEAKEKMAREAQ